MVQMYRRAEQKLRQKQRKYVRSPSGESGGGWGCVMNWGIGIDMYTLMCIKRLTNKKNK